MLLLHSRDGDLGGSATVVVYQLVTVSWSLSAVACIDVQLLLVPFSLFNSIRNDSLIGANQECVV